ncbi:MAG: hypothetical protein ACK44F_17085, partial [Roseococcus sp.]
MIPSAKIGHIATMRCIVAGLFALPLLAAPAAAQGVIVVPEGAEVVVPPRGAGTEPSPHPARAGAQLERRKAGGVVHQDFGLHQRGGGGG